MSSTLCVTFPKWPAVCRQDRLILPVEQAFFALNGVCGCVNAWNWRIGPRTRIILARRRSFSAWRTDLSCCFRSVWAWIAVTRIAAALAIGVWRREWPLPSGQ